MKNTQKKHKIEFSKIFVAAIAIILFVYGIYAGIAFYKEVELYYDAVKFAIEHGQEYMNISQPDPQLAIVCVTSILASFVTYCAYAFGLKSSLNANKLSIDDATGLVMNIANADTKSAICDVIEKEKTGRNSKSSKKDSYEDDSKLR